MPKLRTSSPTRRRTNTYNDRIVKPLRTTLWIDPSRRGDTRRAYSPLLEKLRAAPAAALLAEGESTLRNIELCDDTRSAMRCIEALGADVTVVDPHTLKIRGGLAPRGRTPTWANRVFRPGCSHRSQPLRAFRFASRAKGTLLRRPMTMMIAPLRQLGVEVRHRDGFLPFDVCGPLHSATVEVDGSVSSQFITGLLLALPAARGEFTIDVRRAVSTPYIDMTVEAAHCFGAEILHNGYTQFYIEGGQRYRPTDYSIEGDWSAAATLLVAGAVAGEVTLHNVSILSKQADTAVCTALVRAGAELIHEADRITVRRRPLRAFEFDATQCPDLFPPLAALAAACEGESLITGTSRLAHKESDRAETLREEYAKVGIEIDLSTPDVMRIRGGAIRPARVFSHGDHRIAMSMAVSTLRSSGTITIEGAEAVAKSYPRFFEDLESLRVN